MGEVVVEAVDETVGREVEGVLGLLLGSKEGEGLLLGLLLGCEEGSLKRSVGEVVVATGEAVGDLVNPSALLEGEQEQVPPSAGSITSSCDIIPRSS